MFLFFFFFLLLLPYNLMAMLKQFPISLPQLRKGSVLIRVVIDIFKKRKPYIFVQYCLFQQYHALSMAARTWRQHSNNYLTFSYHTLFRCEVFRAQYSINSL